MTDGVEPEKSNATKLLERLEKWQMTPNGVSVLAHRDEGDGWWRIHVETMGWLDELERNLEQLPEVMPVKYLRPGLEAARQAILCVNYPMDNSNSGARPHLTEADLGMIAGAVGMVNGSGWRPEVVGALTELFPYVNEARELIESVELDSEARSYLLLLVDRFSQALKGVGLRGESEVRQWALELIGALAIYATSGDDEQRDKVTSFWQRFCQATRKFLVQDVPPALASGAVDAALLALTTGS